MDPVQGPPLLEFLLGGDQGEHWGRDSRVQTVNAGMELLARAPCIKARHKHKRGSSRPTLSSGIRARGTQEQPVGPMGAAPHGGQETVAPQIFSRSPVPGLTRRLSVALSPYPHPSVSLRPPVSVSHPGCVVAATTSPSTSTSASSAAMMEPDPIRPRERTRERWMV